MSGAKVRAVRKLELYLQYPARRAGNCEHRDRRAEGGVHRFGKMVRRADRRAVVRKPADTGHLLALLHQAVGKCPADAIRKPQLVGGPEP
jgi:hypothetical protein